MDSKDKSLFQEKLVGLYLRLNGYLQSGFIPHSKEWGRAGTDIDRIGIRFPKHTQAEREVACSPLLMIPDNSIDIIVAEVKTSVLSFNDTLTKAENGAEENWMQLLNWIGLFSSKEVKDLVPRLMTLARQNNMSDKGQFDLISHTNDFGLITIRPILFVIEREKEKNQTKLWINGIELLEYIWECFCPLTRRDECSTRYPFQLWGMEYSSIVTYLKQRCSQNKGMGSLDEMYDNLS